MNNHQRNQSVQVAINKSFHHDLSHQHLTTMDFFRLQPLTCIECVAGDKMSLNVQSLVESAPLATKVYGSYHLDLHAFFVPFRLLWSQWNDYYYSATGADTLFSVPSVDFSLKSISDIFVNNNERRKIFGSLGYPTTQLSKEYASVVDLNAKRNISLMPARAYQLIWWDWYRDSQNLPESNRLSYISTSGGPQNAGYASVAFTPRYRTYRKDYITTLLTQASASLPGSPAEVDSVIDAINEENVYNSQPVVAGDGVLTGPGLYENLDASSATVTGAKILQVLRTPVLRGAAAMQRWLERLGISGTRPLERIVSNFGVRPEPSRLQMSEYIGGKTINLGIEGLINTGSSSLLSGNAESMTNSFGDDVDSYFGTQTGRSKNSGQTETFQYHAKEHGYLMVIGSIVPNYINDGYLDPMFTRGLSAVSEGSVDFFVPEMDGSGYKAVTLSQIATPSRYGATDAWKNADIDQVVGYHPRYEDYRFIMDRISGDFNEQQSKTYLRNMAFVRSLPSILQPTAVVAGLNLTTPTESDRALFDNHFQVANSSLDHFIVNNWIVVDAIRPISSSVLPTELSNLANKDLVEVSRGGIRL